jgi:CO/xanthine dehydrogenase Mo-binding subunit
MRQQMEGCLTMGLGYTLSEEVHFKDGEVLDRNFGSYELPRFSWLPKIETILIDNPGAAALGGGEPPIITVGRWSPTPSTTPQAPECCSCP